MPRDPIPLNEQKKEARHFAALLNIRRDFKPFGGRFHINNSTFKATAFFDNVGDLLWNTILRGGGGGGGGGTRPVQRAQCECNVEQ